MTEARQPQRPRADGRVPAPPGAGSRGDRGLFIGAAAVSAVCLALYANAIANPFHFDDISIILTDPRVQGFQLRELLTGNYWYLPNTDRLYRPLTMLSYAANWAVAPHPWAFRLPNLALHATACLLLMAFVRRAFGSHRAALAAGLAFAVHPLGTEPLNTIVGRADLLVTAFMLGAAVLYWDDGLNKGRGWHRPVLAALMLAAGLASKENAVTLPGVVAALDLYRLHRRDVAGLRRYFLRRLLRCYLPMLVLLAGYLVLRTHLLGSLTSTAQVVDYFENPIAHPEHALDAEAGDSPFLVRWGTPLATLARAVRLALVPTTLCFDYSYVAFDAVRRWSDQRLWVGVGLVSVAAVALLVSVRRGARVALALAFAAITYSIVSNVLVVIGTVFGERLLYLPNLAYCMLIGLLADFAFAPGQSEGGRPVTGIGLRRVTAAALVVLGFCYAFLTVERNRDWRSPRALYESAYRVNPRSCKVLVGMAANALEDDDTLGCLRLCEQVVDEKTGVAPEYWPAWRTAAVALRRMAAETDDPKRCRLLKQQALQRFVAALRHGAAGDPEAMLGAADLLVELAGDYAQAIDVAEKLLQSRPGTAAAHDRLAQWLITASPPKLRDPQRALAHAERARAIEPAIANYAATHADVLAALGRTQEALDLLRRTLGTLPPESPGVPELRRRLEALEHRK